jgi:hypothetical protein
MINELFFERAVEGRDRGIIHAVSWRNGRKPRISAVRIAGLRAEISTQDLLNTEQE